MPTATATPTEAVTEPAQPEQELAGRSRATEPVSWVADLVTIAAMLVSLWFVGIVLRRAVIAFQRRLPPSQLVLDLAPVPHLDAARESLRDEGFRLRAALASGGVRNGIVACWVLLEEAASDAGVARLPAQTATEFVVRFLHLLDVDPRPVATLAGLYHEARFSTHPLDEDTRERASTALASVLAELHTRRDPSRGGHVSSTRRTWIGVAVAALLLALVGNGVMVVLGREHDATLIALLALAAVVTGVLVLVGVDAHVRLPWSTRRHDADPDPGEDTRTAMYRHTIEVHLTSRDRDDAVVWQLADLASRRMRQLHGLRYSDDPARATALLGQPLAGWVATERRQRFQPDHRHRRYTVAQLTEVVRRIEQL